MKKKHKLHLSRLFCCNHTCYCVNMVSVASASRYITSASRYHPRYQSRSSMFISGLILRNWPRQLRLTQRRPLSELNSFDQIFMKLCHIVQYHNVFFKFDNGPYRTMNSLFMLIHQLKRRPLSKMNSFDQNFL